jgi:hypothetical protein
MNFGLRLTFQASKHFEKAIHYSRFQWIKPIRVKTLGQWLTEASPYSATLALFEIVIVFGFSIFPHCRHSKVLC